MKRKNWSSVASLSLKTFVNSSVRLSKSGLLLVFFSSLSWPSFASGQTTPIKPGETFSRSLSAGQTVNYTFSGVAGQRISILMAWTSGHYGACAFDLYNPDGSLLITPPSRDRGYTVQITSFALPQDGAYRIRCREASGGQALGYAMTLINHPGLNLGNITMVTGQKVNGSVGAGDLNTYTFTASAGQTVSALMEWKDGFYSSVAVEVYGPDGNTVTNVASADGGWTAKIRNLLITQTGIYQIVCREPSGWRPLSYALTLMGVAITTQPPSQTVSPGANAVFAVGATGSLPLRYQWHFNGEPIIGATESAYRISSVQPPDAGAYSVVVSNDDGAITSEVALLAVEGSLAARATAVVVNGFIVQANVTYAGFGYTNTPIVRIIGGGGSGAQAVAVVTNGLVASINIQNPGAGYTDTPVVIIAPPFIPQPVMYISPKSLLSFNSLVEDRMYQLQADVGGVLVNVGDLFSVNSSIFTQLVSGTTSPKGYRLATIPVPQQASAHLQIVNGFVIGVTVDNGGSGYTTNPAVTIIGNGFGSGAIITAQVGGGSVSNLVLVNPGFGYTNGATLVIEPPPASFIWPDSVTQVMQLNLASLSPYDHYQLEYCPAVGMAWTNNVLQFTPTAATNTQFFHPSGPAGYFRLKHAP